MDKRIIIIFILILAAIIVVIMARDVVSDNPGRKAGNPYELEIDTFKWVDPALIRYAEFRQIRLDLEEPRGLVYRDGRIFLAGDKNLLVISPEGELISSHELPHKPYCITGIDNDLLGIGYKDRFGIYREDGTMVMESDAHSDASVFTAIAVRADRVYIADAGNRRVLIYDRDGNFKNEIRGETGDGTSHGFIVPSPNFHLEIDPGDNLWVANPGVHTLQHYNDQGDVIRSWKASTPKIEGFSGCCNPARFTFLPDGRFVTSEKGIVRIKVYSPAGEFESVVAAPLKFTEDGEAPDLAVDGQGNIIALDVDKRLIRFFNPS